MTGRGQRERERESEGRRRLAWVRARARMCACVCGTVGVYLHECGCNDLYYSLWRARVRMRLFVCERGRERERAGEN